MDYVLNPKAFAQLLEADWEAIGKRLLAFAIWRAQLYWGFVNANTALPKGLGVEDVVQQVIEKTLRGQRKWDPEKGDLEPWLKDQVKSELDALAKSWAAKHERPVLLDDKGEENWRTVAATATKRNPERTTRTDNPETLLVEEDQQREEKLLAEDLVSLVYEAANEIKELVDIVEAIQNGVEFKPRYLAEELDVPVDEMYNRVRRLRRRSLSARREIENG